jgi:hypothetical protein
MRYRIMAMCSYAECCIMWSVIYAYCPNMPFMMSAVILSVISMNVVASIVISMSVVAPNYNLVMLLFKLKIPKTFLIKAYITRLQA